MSKQRAEQEPRRRSNKVMLFTCGLALIAAAVIGILINNATSGSRFENEIVAVNDAFSKGDEKKINEVLNRTVSSGNYAKVEKSLKQYVGDLVKNVNDIKDAADNDVVYSSLEASYLEKNRDRLNDVAEELKGISKNVESIVEDYKKLYDEEGVKSYIEGQNLNDEYSSLFAQNAKLFYDDEDLRNNYDSTLKVLNSSINTEIKALEYLSKHKSDWKIENEKLVFMSGKTNDEFQSILDNVANN